MSERAAAGPTDWTPRQRQVLDLLARGRTNPEIAEALGISLDGAKWHVSEVMGRLGVERREDAAAYWVRENRLVIRFGRRAREALSIAAIRWSAAAGALALIAVATAALVLLAFSRGADDPTPAATATPTEPPASISPTTTPSPTPTTTSTATVRPAPPAGVTDLVVAPDIDVPSGVGLVVATGGYAHGHGGYWQIEQIFHLPGGATRTEPLIAYGEAPAGTDTAANTTGLVANENGSILWMSRCEGTDECFFEGSKPDVTTAFLRSTDGGVTWHEALRLRGEWWVRLGHGDFAYAVNFDGPQTVVAQVPSGSPVPIPDSLDGFDPLHTASGLAWPDREKPVLIDAAGNTVLESGMTDVRLSGYIASPQGDVFTGFMDSDFLLQVAGRGTWRTPPDTTLFPLAWLDSDRLLVSAEYRDRPCGQVNPAGAGIAPAIFDASTGSLAYFAPFFELQHCGGARMVVSVQPADARVNTPGECLNVRSTPGTDGALITCAADHVLLDTTGASQLVGTSEWVEVVLPAGLHGWVDATFLER